MPKREINYPFESTQCYLKDRYANTRAEFMLKNGTNFLEIPPKDFYYQTKAGLSFYLYAGDGILDFTHAQREYDLSEVDLCKVDKALFYALPLDMLDSSTRDFLEIYELNLQKGQNYIFMPKFESIQKQILQNKEQEC